MSTQTDATRRPTIDQLNEAARNARKVRGSWLLLLEEGVMRSQHLFDAAVEPDGKPLRVLRLERVLVAETGCSKATARRVVARIVAASGTPVKQPTVGWLTSGNSRGRRRDLWLRHVPVSRSEPPTPNFPWGRCNV